MEFFVDKNSIVRKIWGKADVVIVIFAGAAAEFALNKAVDWLFFTGKLPADPINRLFSTVAYAQKIIFYKEGTALTTVDQMSEIHKHVEASRGEKIPEWAYRDVLFLLIDYSIRSYELLERKLSYQEKEEVFNVFYRVGDRMMIKDLPKSYSEWLIMRKEHLENHLERSQYTELLFLQYKKHLGIVRFKILQEAQTLVVPEEVIKNLGFRSWSFIAPFIPVYKILEKLKLDWYIKNILLPTDFKEKVKALDNPTG